MITRGVLAGLLLGAATIGVSRLVPPPYRRLFLSFLLVLAAGVYVGAALSTAAGRRELLIHAPVALAFVGGALLAVRGHPATLGVLWALHGLWDLLLHLGFFPTAVVAWYPVACLAYDAVLALALIYAPPR